MTAPTQYASYASLHNRVIMVTGGASGIGAAIVEEFAGQQAQVIFLDIQDDAAEGLIARIEARGLPAPEYRSCDLTNIPSLQACVAQVVERFSTIDVLINNAGNDARHSIEEVTEDYWERSMAVNLKHQFFMAQAVIPGMRKAGRGAIINMSSISWIIPSTGLPVYVMAKAAIVGMTRTLAHEVGNDNIRVNAVLPGAIHTAKQQRLWVTDAYKEQILAGQSLKRMIQPEEVARLLLFLASDDSSAITGQSYVIDGGWV